MSAVPPSSHRSVRTITDCVGICAGVFNENFGMIQFRLSDQEFRYKWLNIKHYPAPLLHPALFRIP